MINNLDSNKNDFKEMFFSKLENKLNFLSNNIKKLFNNLKKMGLDIPNEPHYIISAQNLEKLQIIDKSFKKKRLRWNTKIYYEQNRFNLFVENPEGFSMLITEVLLWKKDKYQVDTSILRSRLLSIIGEYGLDPLRVCDILLDVLSVDSEDHLLQILELFSKDNILMLMKYRLHSVHNPKKAKVSHSVKNLKLIFKFCLQLFKINLLSLEDIWNSLSPEDEDTIFTQFMRKEQLAFEYFENNFVVMIKHNERKKEEDLKRKKLIEEYFESGSKANKTSSWSKIILLEVFFNYDYQEGINWVLQRWADGLKIDWTIRNSLFEAFTRFLHKRLTLTIAKYVDLLIFNTSQIWNFNI